MRVLAYNNLAIMLDAGLPLLRALETVAQGLKGHLPIIFRTIHTDVSKGLTLADAMKKHPAVFSSLDTMVINAAEYSGSLPTAFKQLADWHTFSGRITRMMNAHMIFPFAIITIAALVIPAPEFFLGKITLHQYIVNLLSILSILYVPALIILIYTHFFSANNYLRKIIDFLALRIPLLAPAIKKLAICRYCRAFHMLYSAGIPITDAAELAARTCGNFFIASQLEGAAKSAKDGNPMFQGFSSSLPPEFLNAWQVAEESGSLDITSKRLADAFGDSAAFLFEQFGDWLPKIAYGIVAVIMIIAILRNASLIGSNLYSF